VFPEKVKREAQLCKEADAGAGVADKRAAALKVQLEAKLSQLHDRQAALSNLAAMHHMNDVLVASPNRHTP
jgi:hypothetical protein